MLPVVTWRGHGGEVPLIDGLSAAYTDIFAEIRMPPDTKFIYIAPVLDYWRLSKAKCHKNNVPHFSEWIAGELLQAIMDRGFLIFDHSNEGHAFEPALFQEIECWTADHGIPQERVAFVQQNRNYGAQYKAHNPDGRFKFFYFDYYQLKTYVACARAADTQDPGPGERTKSDQPYPFLCFNYAPRPHRILLMLALLKSGILGRSIVSFAGFEVCDKGSFVESNLLRFQNWAIYPALAEQLPHLRALGTLTIDDVKNGGNALAFDLNESPYTQVRSVLVSETDSTDGSIRRVTEKSIKPLFFEKPFLIHGNSLSLSLLREYGFQTFHPIIDETYDTVANSELRFSLLLKEIQRLADASPDEWERLLEQTREICSFNRRFLVSGAIARYYDLQVAPLLAWLRSL
jgi:hypothetical protein